MKAILEFNLDSPDDAVSHQIALAGNDLRCALCEIRSNIFRPARKHGYSDEKIQALLENSDTAQAVVTELEKMFNEILVDFEVDHLVD